jgi:putative endonuclease
MHQHFEERGRQKTFAGRYFCFNLIYYERHTFIEHAIDREKEIKKWRREKKEVLINAFNPEWKFLNEELE